MKSRFWPHVIVLCALLLPAVAGMEVRAEPAAMGTAVPNGGINRLYPEEMDPPGSCGVPLGGPFGQDVEVLLNDVQYELEPGWAAPGWLAQAVGSVSGLAAAPLGTERIAAAWQEELLGSRMLRYSIWDAASGWGAAASLSFSPQSNPAILATGGDGWEVYARDGDGQIQYSAWLSPTEFSVWQPVSGTQGAASDPVVVSRRSGNTALFYRDDSGGVWFTEREGGGAWSAGRQAGAIWRASPLLLTPHRAFLPLVFQAGSGAAARPPEGEPSGLAAPSPIAFVSELSAISRNENHLAVFGVDNHGRLMVKEWVSRSASDWSDTEWVALMEGVAPEKPGVASRHSNHLAVAVRDTSGVAHTVEWADQTGWGSPVSLGETFARPLTLAAVDTDELFLFGVGEQGDLRSMHWAVDVGWEGPEIRIPEVWTRVIPAAVRRADDVMILYNGPGFVLPYCGSVHYTSQGRDPTPTDRQFALPQSEHYRNQVLARVGSRSYYLAADEGSGTWKVEAWDLDGDLWQPRLFLDDHPYVAGNPVSVAAGDLDFDGSDEIVIATHAPPTVTLSVLDLIVVDPDTAPELTMEEVATVSERLDAPPVQDLSLAIGDLDGDLRRNEVVLAATLADPAAGDDPLHAVAKLYQFLPGAPAELQEKSDGFLTIDDDSPWDGHWELEVATGRLGLGYPGEQLAVTISGERNCTTGCDWMEGFVSTYGIDPAGWTLESEGYRLAVAHADPHEYAGAEGNPYRSDVATGDLDADGYDEIAAWYLDRVFVIDPNDPDGIGDPPPGWWLDPKSPDDGLSYWQSSRSLAVGDLDRDGRAEIAAAATLLDEGASETEFRYALLELLGDGELSPVKYGPAQPLREEGTVLVGDVDGDGLVSELVGCSTFGEYTVVAVVNGLPRWYEDGVPVFDSTGSYSVEEGGGSSEEAGTSYSIGASLSIGYETEINIPFVGKVAEFRASVTQEVLGTSGFSEEREVFTAYGSDYSFEEGLGIVVYNIVPSACYYYDVFRPDNPLETSRAMSCRPGGGSDTLVMTLEQWHAQSTKDAAGWSWVDVGHRAPGGALTNDLLEPGNYRSNLPVDEFLLLFEWPLQTIDKTGGASESWYANQATGGSRTEFESIEENTTASVGATAGGVSVDASASFGMGWDNSSTVSWSDSISFAGGYSWADGGDGLYKVAPYVYQATARTLAGFTYPYWAMDYYVPYIGP